MSADIERPRLTVDPDASFGSEIQEGTYDFIIRSTIFNAARESVSSTLEIEVLAADKIQWDSNEIGINFSLPDIEIDAY